MHNMHTRSTTKPVTVKITLHFVQGEKIILNSTGNIDVITRASVLGLKKWIAETMKVVSNPLIPSQKLDYLEPLRFRIFCNKKEMGNESTLHEGGLRSGSEIDAYYYFLYPSYH